MRHLIFTCFVLIFAACSNDTTVEDTTSQIGDATENIVNNVKNTQLAEKLVTETIPEVKEETDKASEVVEALADKASEPEKVVNKEPKKEEPKKEKRRSKISFKEKSWNFGDIKDGDIVNHDFKFKNIGNAPLEVKNVTATCGCTQPSFPFLPIAPGEEGVISVTFNSKGKINEQRPTVTVITNGRPSIVKLNLEGMVRPK